MLDSIALLDVAGYRQRSREHPDAVGTEDFEERAVFELGDDARDDAVLLEPEVQ
jgi:hypothetical protein